MERNALQDLIEWNNNKRKKPLIVWGASGQHYRRDDRWRGLIVPLFK